MMVVKVAFREAGQTNIVVWTPIAFVIVILALFKTAFTCGKLFLLHREGLFLDSVRKGILSLNSLSSV